MSDRVVGQLLHPVLGHDDRVGVTEAAESGVVQAGLDREHHSGLEHRRVAEVEERSLVIAQADPVAGVLPPVPEQVVLLEVAHDRAVDVGARRPRPDRGEGGFLRRDGVLEQSPLLVRRRADDHPALELGVVAPDRRARLGHEHVAGVELDRVRDRVRPCAADADLAAIAGGGAVRGREPSDLAALGEHGERRLVFRREGSPPPRSRRAACTPAAGGARARTSGRSRG